ncbi:MAG: NAD(P)H-hydrate dehydratase [Bacteroidetes bacterium]|nr:MAG: NAD(P)H-hydrate dehydratase [Bacteroidota bacterium]
MKLYTAAEIRAWDDFSIKKEGINSYALMQRAAKACFNALASEIVSTDTIAVLAGPGNNGGDALLIAQELHRYKFNVTLFAEVLREKGDRSLAQNDCELALNPLDSFIPENYTLVIEGLFGTGLSRPLSGNYLELITKLNAASLKVISIDIPSGMPSDLHEGELYPCVKASQTLTFQVPKLAFLSDDYAAYTGRLQVMDIGLSKEFSSESRYALVDFELVKSLYKPRRGISHKGDYGRALLLGGNRQTGGAVLLASEACLRTGAGLVTMGIPRSIQLSALAYLPEAMQVACGAEELDELPNLENYQAIAVGPGMGTGEGSIALVEELVSHNTKRMVWDADALNILSGLAKRFWPKSGIFTPHPGEFDRLFGKHQSQMERAQKASRVAQEMNWHILLKGSNSMLFFPDGRIFIHKGQIPALAKGGSGDILCGMLCSLLAQGYSLEAALLLAVYSHAQAAKRAAANLSDESVLARDIIRELPKVFRTLSDA